MPQNLSGKVLDGLRALKIMSNRKNTQSTHQALRFSGEPLFRIALIFGLLFFILFQTGCRIKNIDSARRLARVASFGSKPLVEVKRQKRLGTIGPVRRLLIGRPDPSERTLLFLRNRNLSQQYIEDPPSVVSSLQEDCRCDPNMVSVHAIAELAQMEADWKLRIRNPDQAAKYYATAVVHAYQFLFDPKLNLQRNAYDPQFREICDIYNKSLEHLLRLLCQSEDFHSGGRHKVGDGSFGIEFEVVVEGRWQREEFEKFELVSDFETHGIDNKYHTYGLGVPLIAVRKPKTENRSRFEKYYPPSLALPLTAFCEVQESAGDDSTLKAVLRLYDPLEKTVIKTETRNAPLESDLTVPLAYHLNDPLLNTDVLSTVALLDAEVASDYFGFYMLEPFDPDKIPVVMVHGLWSNPVTWMEMFNDLRANQWIRDHYQFWFYMYPTGQPFWFSAQQMRGDLAQLRKDVDPGNHSKHLNEIVLVGHSMGGLLSRMQTIDSGDGFWQILSDESIDKVTGDPETIQRINDLFYFEADPAIRKVVTIASPHRGSSYANNATRWLSHQLFRLPKMLTTSFDEFCKTNSGILRNTKHLTVPTSIDSLSPESPFIQKMAATQLNKSVQFHNIVGSMDASSWVDKIGHEPGDGVVSLASALLPDAKSEIRVPAEHVTVHQHPETILEVKRILIENLVETKRIEMPDSGPVAHESHSDENER